MGIAPFLVQSLQAVLEWVKELLGLVLFGRRVCVATGARGRIVDRGAGTLAGPLLCSAGETRYFVEQTTTMTGAANLRSTPNSRARGNT